MKTLLTAKTTNQKLFNQVVKHLLTQNQQSKDYYGGCMYRGGMGLACAIGACISNRAYEEDMEGHTAPSLINKFFPDAKHLVVLAYLLQEVHDSYYPEQWPKRLQHVAIEFKLKTPSILKQQLGVSK